MEEFNGESKPDTMKSNHPISIDAEVQTEDGMHYEGKFYRGRGRGHCRGGGRNGRGFKRRARGANFFMTAKSCYYFYGIQRRRFGHTGTVDDFPFLHGGNSKDPLNLKSVKPVDEAENTKPIDIIIPKNIHDPLNLRNVNKNRARRKRRNSKLAEKEEVEGSSENISKRRANIAESIGKLQPSSGAMAGVSNSQTVEIFKTEEEKTVDDKEKKSEEKRKNNQKFRYGNYTRYYGSRIEKGSGHDPRMKVLKKEWFAKKSVLDIGCNVGYLTLSIAKEYQPRNIVGIDIDAHLVGVARKNIRHYCDKDVPIVGGFPASFAQRYGPISAPLTAVSIKFPDNIWFRCENYVLEKDELLDAVKEEYDVIMALSITKWIHLNWGDTGIKRFFKRVYRHLRPGGLFILEPQSFETYKKRAKLTKDINEMYKTIEFMPDAFEEYLIVDIGFDFCQRIDPPKAYTKDSFPLHDITSEDIAKTSIVTKSHPGKENVVVLHITDC
ncbi:7SK snRNA methylphosphate capping enzyme [Dirofilaria immitis]|nr:7SK snRNA methylphosphate capping enzyme [Dirofilaria immitis]